MKKIILIIFMAIISSCSYYGAVNEKGEKVTDFENTIQEQEDIKQEKNSNQIEMQEQNEEQEEQKEKITEQEITQNSDKSIEVINTTNKTTNNVQKNTEKRENTTKSKTQEIEDTTEKQQNKNTVNTSEEQIKVTSQSNSGYNEKEVQVAPKTECVGNNHKISSGNSKRWFKTEQEAIKLYDKLQKEWSDKLISGATSDEEYDRNCPYGYETWDCPNCKQWTINFYYR